MATQASDTSNKQRARGGSPDELAVVAQRAQAFTNASGVAIALSEGNADEIVCRARSGSAAPEVGTTLRVEGSFTGLCISSGKELRCDDCETDTRVDTVAIRALGIRSMVVTPIKEENRVIGVLAVFAPTPHAFTITHVAVLKTMGDQIAALLQRERRAREEGIQPEPARPAAPVTMPKPVMSASAPVVSPPVVIKPSSSGSVPVARTAPPVVSRVEQVRSPAPVEPAPSVSRKEDKREHRSEQTQRASFGTFDAVGGEAKKPRSNMMAIGVVAVLVIAAGGTFAFLKMRKPDAPTQQPVQTASNTAPAVPAGAASTTAAGTQPGAATETPATTATSNPGGAAPTATKPAPVREPESRKPEKNTAKPVDRTPPPQEKPVPTPATVALASGPSKIATPGTVPTAPDVAPSITVGGGNTPSALSALAKPTASSTPSAAAIEQSQLEPLQLLKTVPTPYPAIAKARRLSGLVVVQVKVGKDGKVSNPQFISGPMVFRDSAFDAVLQYQFKPAKLNGQPIEQSTQIKLNFRPN
jgi:TonB family protein